jgi:two-component system sensor histidine kinase BaeS
VSLRARISLGIAGTVLVSLVVTVVAGALLTRRSLESTAVAALERQVELIATQRREDPARGVDDELGRFLSTDEQRLAILTPAQADALLPDGAARRLESNTAASGSLEVRGTRFLFAARESGGEAIVLLRPASSLSADWRPFALGLGLAGLVGAVLAAAVAFVLARAVARPVARVSDASRSLAEGETPQPVPVTGPPEVATLATSFNHLADELRRTQDAERAFLLSVSHELKTPLTAIRGHAEALQDGVFEATPTGVVVEREARRLERLVGDLLDLARLRRRAFSVRAETVDLEEVALSAYRRHEVAARAFGVELEVLAEPHAAATADADRVLQALSNLVENALRSTPRGGSVRIVARPGRLEVVDDGPGLATDDVGRAFERFYLYDRYATERRVGTGLGLAIVHELAEAMGGTAEVRSEPGAGATFSIVLPRSVYHEARCRTSVRHQTNDGRTACDERVRLKSDTKGA